MFFLGVERIKEVFDLVWVNTFARVLDGDDYFLFIFLRGDVKGFCRGFFHSIYGVQDNVEEGLLHLGGVEVKKG